MSQSPRLVASSIRRDRQPTSPASEPADAAPAAPAAAAAAPSAQPAAAVSREPRVVQSRETTYADQVSVTAFLNKPTMAELTIMRMERATSKAKGEPRVSNNSIINEAAEFYIELYNRSKVYRDKYGLDVRDLMQEAINAKIDELKSAQTYNKPIKASE